MIIFRMLIVLDVMCALCACSGLFLSILLSDGSFYDFNTKLTLPYYIAICLLLLILQDMPLARVKIAEARQELVSDNYTDFSEYDVRYRKLYN